MGGRGQICIVEQIDESGLLKNITRPDTYAHHEKTKMPFLAMKVLLKDL